jgi:tRNA(Ile2) C34 agmatinyltransferase TiaS
VLIIAPVGEAEPATYTCGVCGFVMNEAGECPRCKLAVEEMLLGPNGRDDLPDILDQVRELLDGTEGDIARTAGG